MLHLVGYNQFGNRILRQTKPIIIRIRPLCINNNDSYFYQLLLKHRNWRSDAEIRGSYDNYRDRYLALFPDALRQIQHENSAYIERTRFEFNQQFAVALDSILHRLSNELSIRNIDILRMQLLSLQPAPYIMPRSLTLNLPSDQYYVMNTLTHWMGSMSNDKYPYFFVTGSAGTGKTYIIRLLCQFLSTRRSKYLLMAPTGVAAQNIGGKTIHSELRITSSQSGFQTLVHHDVDLRNSLREIDTIIIDEVSMVSAPLLSFISNLFGQLHNNYYPFGGISVVVVDDLTQLPPVNGPPIYLSPVWSVFYPLFLTTSHCQETDMEFYELLEAVHYGNITSRLWNVLLTKYRELLYQLIDIDALTTYIVSYCKSAQKIDTSFCNMLVVEDDNFLLNDAIDYINNELWENQSAQSLFKHRTNLPTTVRLQRGARVMFLNNQLFDVGICNGTIGVVTNVDPDIKKVRVMFCSATGIRDVEISPITVSFHVNGNSASRTQFPLMNCFAITVHKAQGLTLPKIGLFLDEQFFAPGQAYVALSRASCLDNVAIHALNKEAFSVDRGVIAEYSRLQEHAQQTPFGNCNFINEQ